MTIVNKETQKRDLFAYLHEKGKKFFHFRGSFSYLFYLPEFFTFQKKFSCQKIFPAFSPRKSQGPRLFKEKYFSIKGSENTVNGNNNKDE